MELEEKVKSLKRRVALLSAKVKHSNEDPCYETQTEVSWEEEDRDSRSQRLRQSIAEAKEKN